MTPLTGANAYYFQTLTASAPSPVTVRLALCVPAKLTDKGGFLAEWYEPGVGFACARYDDRQPRHRQLPQPAAQFGLARRNNQRGNILLI